MLFYTKVDDRNIYVKHMIRTVYVGEVSKFTGVIVMVIWEPVNHF